MLYTPRLSKPEKGNKYYNTKSNGGYSRAITGKCKDTGKADTECNVLANCVGYAYGRFNEIGKYESCKYLSPVNAENFPEYATGCKTGSEPRLGSVIVWQKGTTLKGTDGAGHVAIVEDIISENEILISQSGYNSKSFWTEKITKKNNQWMCSWMSDTYKFRCFIYNPTLSEDIRPSLKKGDKNIFVKELQENLNKLGSTLAVDSSFGSLCELAVKEFQASHNLTSDGVVGQLTYDAIDTAIKDLQKTKTESKLTFRLNNKDVTALTTNILGQDYIRMMDLKKLGIVKSIKWNSLSGKIKVTK